MKTDPSGKPPVGPPAPGFRAIATDRSWPHAAALKPSVHAAWRYCSRVRGQDPGPEKDFQYHPAFRACLDAIVAGVRRSVRLPMSLCGAFLTNQRDQKAFVDRHGPAQFEGDGAFAGIAREGLLYFYWWDGQACYVVAPGDPQQVVTVETAGAPNARWLASELRRMGFVADLPPPLPYPDPTRVVPRGGFAVIAPRLLLREADVPSLDAAAQGEIGEFLSGLASPATAIGGEPVRTYVDLGISGAYEALGPKVRLAIRVTDDAYLSPTDYPGRASSIRSQRRLQWMNLVIWLRAVPRARRAVLVLRPDAARLPMEDILLAWKKAVPDLPDADLAPPTGAGSADTVTAFDPSLPSGSRWTVLPL